MQAKTLQQGAAHVLLALGGLLALSAQAQEAVATPAPGMVRICDDSGCSNRPVSSATFDTPANAPSAPSPQLQRLMDLAEKNPKAAYDLGLRYFRGDGVGRDSYEALKWMRSAGDRGVREAQLALGKLYLSGLEEMGADPAEAESWLGKAAAAGSAEAAQLLPQARRAKNGDQQDYAQRQKQSKTWYILWHRTAPYYWYWRGNTWICQHCY